MELGSGLCKKISRGVIYCVFVILLFLMWAKPIEVNNDYTEVDGEGHIIRVNGKSFQQYLADQGVDIRDIEIADKEFYLKHYDDSIQVVKQPSVVDDGYGLSEDKHGLSEDKHTLDEENHSLGEKHNSSKDQCMSEQSCSSNHHHHHHHHHEKTNEIRDEDKHPYLAVFLTTISALAATVGGAFVVFCYTPSNNLLGWMLGFSAGIMLYISYMDIMVHAQDDFGENGMLLSNIWMFVGMAGFLFLSHLLPEGDDEEDEHNLKKTGWITALGISLHNFPEGLVVFNATVVGVCNLPPPTSFSLSYAFQYLTQCTGRGIMTAVAIAIHNIPEGIAVALPIYYSTKSKKEALKWCILSSLCEPIAAIIFGLFFTNYITTTVMASMNAMVAGIMIVLCIYELIPTALKYTDAKNVAVSIIVGQVVMFISLYLLIETGAH